MWCRIVAETTTEHRINDRIRAREVRLVDPDGVQLGIKALPEALAIAKELDLDLVEVAPMANPPVCRIMDFGKFKFDEAQRAKESRRKTVHVGIKEMKYRPKIGPGDFDTKTRQVAKFLNEGHKVKITIMFRGREVYHPEHGKRILDRIAEQMEGIAKIEAEPKLDNRNMIMVLAPDKRARQAAASRTANQHRGDKTPSTNGNQPVAATAEAPPADVNTTTDTAPTDTAPTETHQPKRDDDAMPKMKTDKGAAKRIKITGTGRLRRDQAFRGHNFETKSSVRTRRLGRARRRIQVGREVRAEDARHLMCRPGRNCRATNTNRREERRTPDGQSQAIRPWSQAPPRRAGTGEGVLRQQEPYLPVGQRAAHALDAVRLPGPPRPQG